MKNSMSVRKHISYFERACLFFQHSGLSSSPGSYFIHNKNLGEVRLGTGVGRRAELSSQTGDGENLASMLEEERVRFEALKADLGEEVPCFFLISGDFQRGVRDEGLPLAIFVQPRIEFCFSDELAHGETSYAKDPDAERYACQLLSAFMCNVVEPCSVVQPTLVPPFSDISEEWERLETDETFLQRLENGIQALQDHPQGKMTMMRSFQKRVAKSLDRFDLFRLHARNNGEYACSHFFCLEEGIYSLGCSPENAFEIIADELRVDVVAATCKSGQGEAFEKRELFQNPKQVKEHMVTAETRKSRYASFCVGGIMQHTKRLQIKRLRNVCHLYSLLIGALQPNITMFDIIQGLFPIMGARPKELLPVSDSERSPHHFYGGIVGHWGAGYTGCFLNLRNALIQDDMLHAKVGMGVLRESNARNELVETEDKVSGLMEAVFLWHRGNGARFDN
ncbi:MAG: hypothetical protein DSY85_04420 [Marinomonas sp.]|nr:MAG: hypothetical protein DSY85_04420 [Marinomonas sp.]